MARFLILGHPGSERVRRFQAALARRALPLADVLPWAELLARPGALEARLAPGTLLRVESPGEDAAVQRLLLARGADEPDDRLDTPRLSAAGALALRDDPGRILFPRQLHLGFRSVLRAVEAALAARPDALVMNAPAEIAVMGDKPACHEMLAAAGVPRPRVLGTPRGFEELQALMERDRCPRVFVKLANGSSASGVVAYQTDGRRHLAITTVEQDGPRLYNSTRLRRYGTPAEVAELFDLLCREGVIVERWVPKAAVGDRTFDLRVVVIAGRARQVGVRTSPWPLTNLHLGGGNRRGAPAAARARVGEEHWAEALGVAERALACFPSSLYGGVDILVPADGRGACVAEVNAFGDLLRRTLHEGQDPYDAEVEASLAGMSS